VTDEPTPDHDDIPAELDLSDQHTAELRRNLGEQMQQVVDARRAILNSPGLKAAAESMQRVNEMIDSPAMKAAAEAAARLSTMLPSPGILAAIQGAAASGSSIRAISDSIARLNSIPRTPAFSAELATYVSPDVRTVTTLYEVRGELEGMATILEESARQQAVLVEVTRANLTATQALIAEEQQTREASARSDRFIIWLTVALFVVGAVGAVAVAAAFAHQLSDWWTWLRSNL